MIAGADSPSRPTAANKAMTRDRVLGRPSGSRRFPSTRSAYVAFAVLPQPGPQGWRKGRNRGSMRARTDDKRRSRTVTELLGEREHVSDICTGYGLVRRGETATGPNDPP